MSTDADGGGLAGLSALSFTAESVARWRTVLALRAGPRTFDDLRSALDTPQSTLNRNLTKLASAGWVREEPTRTYGLTPVGREFTAAMADAEAVLAVFDRLAGYPDAIPADEFDFPLRRLADALVTDTTEAEDPYAVVNRVRDIISDAQVVRGFRPVFMPAYIGATAQVARSPDGQVVGMVPSHQLDAAREDEDFDMGAVPYDDNVEFRVWDGDVDFALAVIDEELVILTCEHGGGVPDLLVESRDPAVRAWAEERIDDIYQRADPVEERV